MTSYQQMIREDAASMGLVGKVDPRHVEAWMRLEYGTLDARPRSDFRAFIRETIAIEQEAPGESEKCARSFGL